AGLVAGQVERHLDAAIAPQELEARGDAGLDHVLRRIAHEEPDEGDQHDRPRGLPQDVANLAVAEEGQQSAPHWKAGVNSRPPLVHSSLAPRFSLSGEPMPTVRS